jgi:hypothetical protein
MFRCILHKIHVMSFQMSQPDTLIAKPKTKVKISVKPKIEEESQVIVHCSMPCEIGMGVRIWKTTFLICDTGHKIQLVHWDGITLAPQWTRIFHNGFYNFTLVFKGLPKGCKTFSLKEEIPEPGGFVVPDIHRKLLEGISTFIS